MTQGKPFRVTLASGLWIAVGLALAIGLAWLAWPRPLKVVIGLVDRGPVGQTLADKGVGRNPDRVRHRLQGNPHIDAEAVAQAR
ncbi:MAG: hypothetical protein ACKOEY_08415, partial [Phenylobacterium sp.]